MKKFLNKLTGKQWFVGVCVPLAFLSFISFTQINSDWADRHNFNGVFGWVGIGIVSGLAAIYALIKTAQNSNS